jgi:hypothetical protein|tara:strand:- start:271 stop:813 length:543 start_codon:yes stop_codon:yes gene_type:complete
MNKPTTIDQQLLTYLKLTKNGSSELSDALLDELMDRYNLTSVNTDGFLDGMLKQIHDIQVKSDEILNPKAERFESFDGHVYGLKLDCSEFSIGDEVWNPQSGCPVNVHKDNIDYANEEYWQIVSIEEEPYKEWGVEVCRTSFAHRTIKVYALNYEQAVEKALECAGDYEYSESDAQYSAE